MIALNTKPIPMICIHQSSSVLMQPTAVRDCSNGNFSTSWNRKAVTKRYNRDGVLYGHIIDWQSQSMEAFETAELLDSIWQQLSSWNVQRVSCWADGDSLLEQAVSQEGLSPGGRRSHLCYYDLEGQCAQNLADPNAWKIISAAGINDVPRNFGR